MTPSTVTWTRQPRAGAPLDLARPDGLRPRLGRLRRVAERPESDADRSARARVPGSADGVVVRDTHHRQLRDADRQRWQGPRDGLVYACQRLELFGRHNPGDLHGDRCAAANGFVLLVGHHFPPSTAPENQLRRLRRQHHGRGGRQSVERPARPAGLPGRSRVSNRARTTAGRGLSRAGGEHQSDQPRTADRIGGRSGHPFAILSGARRRLRSRAHHGRHQRHRLARLASLDADDREPAKHAESGDEPERRAVSGDRATNGPRSVRGRSARPRYPSSTLSSASWRQSRA